MRKFIILVLLVLLIANFAYRIDIRKSPHELFGELMYFPSGVALRALSVGLYAPVADFTWFRFIQYYGEHRLTDRKYEFMYHILDILTTLDSRFIYAYTLGGLMLTHDAKRPDQARMLMKKGMKAQPEEWRIPFIYAFIHYVFLKEYHVARTYFRLAALKPDAPDIPKRWAAFTTYKKIGDLKTALALWIDLYNSSENPEEKQIAEMYIQGIRMKMDVEFLDRKIDEFKVKLGRRPIELRELVRHGIIDSIPLEPHGAEYTIRQGKAFSTWKLKGDTLIPLF